MLSSAPNNFIHDVGSIPTRASNLRLDSLTEEREYLDLTSELKRRACENNDIQTSLG